MREDSIAIRALLFVAIVANTFGSRANAQTTRVAPDTIRLGAVELRLGLDEADVLKRFAAAVYRTSDTLEIVARLLGRELPARDARTLSVWDPRLGRDPAEQLVGRYLGDVAFRNGRLDSVRKSIWQMEGKPGLNEVVPMLARLHDLVKEIVKTGRDTCTLSTDESILSGIGVSRSIAVRCGALLVQLHVGEPLDPSVSRMPGTAPGTRLDLILSDPR